MTTAWLVDKSALVRLAASRDIEEWASRIERGLVHITTVTRLEVGLSARAGTDARAAFRNPPLLLVAATAELAGIAAPSIPDPGSRCCTSTRTSS